jgi:molybdopterin synthase catalytic subunit
MGHWIEIVDRPIQLERVYSLLGRKDCGAVSIFIGSVRDHNLGKEVTGIQYTAFKEMAQKELTKIAERIVQEWGIKNIVLIHRIGRLLPGEISVVVGVSSEHRAEAFEACSFAIQELKRSVPIWKQEIYKDGKAWIEQR